MHVTIDIPQPVSLHLAEEAQRDGVSINEIVTRTLLEKFPAETSENFEALRLIEQWISEAPTTPETIAEAEADLREFQLAVNATRKDAGARAVYPGAS